MRSVSTRNEEQCLAHFVSLNPINTSFVIIEQLCRGTEPGNRWKPLVLVIPLRLGLSEINPIYLKGLKV